MSAYRYTVPKIPPSINKYLGRNNEWAYRTIKDEWTHRVAWCCRTGVIPRAPLPRAHISITFFFPDNRRRDLDNITKPVLDGLVSAKVITDDSWQCIRLSLQGGIDRQDSRVEILVEAI